VPFAAELSQRPMNRRVYVCGGEIELGLPADNIYYCIKTDLYSQSKKSYQYHRDFPGATRILQAVLHPH
jgi:hypothetical protein